MHPIITLKTWGQQHHMMETDGLRELSRKLVHDPAFWTVIAMTTLIVVLMIMAMNAPRDFSPNMIPQHPYPMYMY